jgi:ribosomal protein L11
MQVHKQNTKNISTSHITKHMKLKQPQYKTHTTSVQSAKVIGASCRNIGLSINNVLINC